MTDKELFLNEIEAVKLIIQANRAQGAFSEGYLIGQESVLEHFEKFVRFMQEEPVHRTKTDIDAAMAEIEGKSRAFTEAHKGETAEEILAQMRGEEPASEDLEEEIRKYQKEVYDRDTTVRDVARHFADWQKQQLFKLKEGEKPWSEEDEDNFEDEFAKTLAEKKEILPRGEERFSDMDLYRVALHFCGWKKRQMIKDAVDGEIVSVNTRLGQMFIAKSEILNDDKFKWGDKVKLIIAKKD